ncbi:MAG TPA: N-acetylmuramoyl-L-alanine amidase [Candidatus Binatia bacterium]|nr:N-acetylmuramoyl-L-alanine amidase [Candidatus Binatia bacterium]
MSKLLKYTIICTLILVIGSAAFFAIDKGWSKSTSYSEQEAGDSIIEDIESIFESEYDKKVRELANWKRPEGQFKVALQAGHWKANEAPEEFPNLRENTGTSGGGKTEWQVNLEIAEKTKAILESQGITVEILPATIPKEYWADLFIAIHADGNLDQSTTGYKAAAPRRDMTGRAADFVKVLEEEYEKTTGLTYDPNVTRNMRGYYAFNWRRYEHSLHPMTTGVILETGFLTNPNDRRIIVNNQEKSAQGISTAVMKFKQQYNL